MIKKEDIAKWFKSNLNDIQLTMMDQGLGINATIDVILDCITELSLIEEVKTRQDGKEVDVTIEELERELTSKKMERAK